MYVRTSLNIGYRRKMSFFLQNIQSGFLETLYQNRSNLKTIFRVMDSDHSGKGTLRPTTSDTHSKCFIFHPLVSSRFFSSLFKYFKAK